MGDNQSDNSPNWAPWQPIDLVSANIAIVEDPTLPPTKVTTTTTFTTVKNQYTELDISKFRFRVEDGRAFVVLDVDGYPTYSFILGRKQTNELLQQIINERDE